MARRKRMSGNTLLALGLGGCVGLVFLAVIISRWLKTEPPPPLPPQPPARAQRSSGLPRYTSSYFAAVLAEDAKRLGLQNLEVNVLAQPFAYASELAAPRRLRAERDQLDTAHLHLATRILKEWAVTGNGEGFRYEHTVLEITNRTDKRLAYLVDTSVDHPQRCSSKGAIGHNALALQAGETVRRTECLWHPGAYVNVRRVEVLELPELSYYYVSRLVPSQMLLDTRTSAGHETPKLKPCRFIPWREIQTSSQGPPTPWVDIVDFYSRHNCDEYSFFRGYHRATSALALPARPPS